MLVIGKLPRMRMLRRGRSLPCARGALSCKTAQLLIHSGFFNALQAGAVARSSSPSQRIACARLVPHISSDGCSPPQNAGRSGRPKMAQPLSVRSWTQRTPAGLPLGMPGMGEVIEGAVQQAPQPGLHDRAAGEVIRIVYRAYGCRMSYLCGSLYNGGHEPAANRHPIPVPA
jgi:hypothetical protein